jgi:hypothetical protein
MRMRMRMTGRQIHVLERRRRRSHKPLLVPVLVLVLLMSLLLVRLGWIKMEQPGYLY